MIYLLTVVPVVPVGLGPPLGRLASGTREDLHGEDRDSEAKGICATKANATSDTTSDTTFDTSIITLSIIVHTEEQFEGISAIVSAGHHNNY